MRILFLMAVFCATVANTACAEQSPQVSIQRTSAAHSALNAMFIDSGVLEAAARAGFEQSGAEIWSGWLENPTFGNLAEAKREAIRVYLLSEYPTEATVDVVSHAAPVIEESAPRLAELFREEQLRDIEAFVRSDGGRSWFLRTSAGAEVTPTAEEQRALEEFAQSSAAGTWTNAEFDRLISDMLEELIVRRAPAIRERLAFRICEILAEDRRAWSACAD